MLKINSRTFFSNLYSVDKEQLLTELTAQEGATISGGAVLSVPTTNIIENGRARIRADLREGLKDKNFSGQFESCNASFDDFTGRLNISCALSNQDVNSGQILYRLQK